MTELPEDLESWPSDSFEILGVARDSIDAKAARRAYFKRIKRFKPDKFPLEFQRIREAYDDVQQWLTYQQYIAAQDEAGDEEIEKDVSEDDDTATFDSPFDQETGDGEAEEGDAREGDADYRDRVANGTNGSASDEEQAAEPTDVSDRPRRFSQAELEQSALANRSPFDAFMAELANGRLETAVALLEQPTANPHDRALAELARYHIEPLVDSLSKRSDQVKPVEPGSNAEVAPPIIVANESLASSINFERLLRVLRDRELFYPALERLTVEFTRQPTFARHRLFEQLLSELSDAEQLSELYRLRWRTLGPANWMRVVQDFQSLQPRSLEFGQSWEGLMAESLEYTVWHRAPHAAEHNQKCWDEICASQHSWVADAVELLVLSAEQWQTMPDTPWSQAIPEARKSLPNRLRSQWRPIAEMIANDRKSQFLELNRAFRSHPLAMAVFEAGLERLAEQESVASARPAPDPYDTVTDHWELLREQVACLLSDPRLGSYTSARRMVLEFCVLNRIAPLALGQIATTFQRAGSMASWNELIRNDGPLLCVYHACVIADV